MMSSTATAVYTSNALAVLLDTTASVEVGWFMISRQLRNIRGGGWRAWSGWVLIELNGIEHSGI